MSPADSAPSTDATQAPRVAALEASLLLLGAFFLLAWAAGLLPDRRSLAQWSLAMHGPPLVMLAGAVCIARRHRPLLPRLFSGSSTPVLVIAVACLGLAGGTAIGPTPLGPMARLLEEPYRIAWGFAWVGIAAPVIEEIYFRGVLQAAAGRSLHAGLAIAASTLAFAMAHIGVCSPWLYVGLGVFFGATAAVSGSLLPPIAAHMAWNIGTIAAGVSTRLWGLYVVPLLVAGAALLIVGCALRFREVCDR